MSRLGIVLRNLINGTAASPLTLQRGLALTHASPKAGQHIVKLARAGVAPSEAEIQIVYEELEKMGAEDMKIEPEERALGKKTGVEWVAFPIVFTLRPPQSPVRGRGGLSPQPRTLVPMPTAAGAYQET